MPKRPLSTWEVDLVDLPVRVPGVDIEGLLLVVQTGGLVRLAAPITAADSLATALATAIDAPMAGRPGLPARILVRTPEMAARLRSALGGRRVSIAPADALPSVDEAVATLLEALGGGPRTLGIEGDEAAWNAALTHFMHLAPWDHADDRHRFTFQAEEPRLTASVAVVMGALGEVFGVAVYPSLGSLDHALQQNRSASAICVQVVRPEEVPRDLAEGARRAGLALADGRVPLVFGLKDGEHATLDGADQRLALAAMQAVVALCARHPDFASQRREVITPTVLGRVAVTASPVAPPDMGPDLLPPGVRVNGSFARIEARYDDRPPEALLGVTLTLAKADARRLAERLTRSEHAEITTTGPGRARVVLYDGDGLQGELFEGSVPPPEQIPVVGATDLVLRVCARRKRGEPEGLATVRLANRAPGERARHAPVFDGPPESWPKGSEVLLTYVARAGVTREMLAGPEAQELLDMAGVVWAAVVAEDFLGDRQHIEALRRSPMWRHLEPFVRAKRQMFPTDPRVFPKIEAGSKDGEPHCSVAHSLPPGYPLPFAR